MMKSKPLLTTLILGLFSIALISCGGGEKVAGVKYDEAKYNATVKEAKSLHNENKKAGFIFVQKGKTPYVEKYLQAAEKYMKEDKKNMAMQSALLSLQTAKGEKAQKEKAKTVEPAWNK